MRSRREGAAPRPAPASDETLLPRRPGFCVVGVGASAGGLEAFQQLLEAVPADAGTALVLIQHLDPRRDSSLVSLLSAGANLPVTQAIDGMTIEPNRVYVISPNTELAMSGDSLVVSPRPQEHAKVAPIDHFFASLAATSAERAIGVVLSGSGSDGAVGVRDLKANGGFVICQDPETARYDGMPRAAIATGLVDAVLAPKEIAAEISRIGRHPLVRAELHATTPGDEQEDEDLLIRIFALLRSTSGIDFKRYKRGTLRRRIERRMILRRVGSLALYARQLEDDPSEVRTLSQDLLIQVTRFFREPESFQSLKREVFPSLLGSRDGDRPIRVWIPGCASGEEAYSVAISLLELLEEQRSATALQVFATDVSESALEAARAGTYAETISADVSPERLRRFFTKVDRGYRINRGVRDLVIFARQDLTRDPPFSKLDLVVCRNVLIYMDAELQQTLMQIFNYALRPDGYLVLGHAETIGPHSALFAVVEKKHRIFRKKQATLSRTRLSLEPFSPPSSLARMATVPRDDLRTVQNEANRVVQERFAPPGVIVDGELQIVQFRGQTGAYLEPAPGEPTLSLLKMARDGLPQVLKSALQEARGATGRAVRRAAVKVRGGGTWREIALEIIPLRFSDRPHFLVLFVDPATPPLGTPARPLPSEKAASISKPHARIEELEQELASSREYLQSMIQELEAANEELQSANEEIVSSNEELQSTNEELDTAKEELQSTNEELNTVNEELQSRNDELSRANSDLVNLLGSVRIAVVIVGQDLVIRSFTPMAERLLNLREGDVGRSIAHIKPNVDCPDLADLIAGVIDGVTPLERDVRGGDGHWLLLKVRPYKNVENRIDGAVISLVDVHASRADEIQIRGAASLVTTLLETSPAPVAVVDPELRVRHWNAAFAERFGVDGDSPGHLPEIGDQAWRDDGARMLVEQALRRDGPVAADLELGRERVTVTARRSAESAGESPFVVLVVAATPGPDGRG